MVPFLSKKRLIVYRVDSIIHACRQFVEGPQGLRNPLGASLVPLGAIWFRNWSILSDVQQPSYYLSTKGLTFVK
jgi:hypothetical protein